MWWGAVILGERPYRVIGILPQSFHYQLPADFWVPLAFGTEDWHRSFDEHRLGVIARLKPGVSLIQARADLAAVNSAIKTLKPPSKAQWGATIWPLRDALVEGVPDVLLLLQGAVALVLLIACVNVTNMVLVRAACRSRELALRAALGADRWTLIRQAQLEGFLLAALGGLFGSMMAFWGMKILRAVVADFLPRSQEIQMDGGVLTFALGITLVTGLLCGLGPAWKASRLDLNLALKDGSKGSSSSGQRLSRSLVVIEVALALMLLSGAGILLRRFHASLGGGSRIQISPRVDGENHPS